MNIYDHLQRLRQTISHAKPILLLDIDDTLIDCRYRKHKVFMDFIAQPEVAAQFPIECAKLRLLPWQSVQYRVADNLISASIDQQDFGAALFAFWRQHYFTYPYLIQDIAFPGAVDFVKYFYDTAHTLVYLTGRDQAGMGAGTLFSLKHLGFPCSGPDIHFILKPDVEMGDLEFKRSALEDVAALGPLLAAFENELGNLNAMALRFPEAAMYWRKTLYAPDPPTPHPRVIQLDAFPAPPTSLLTF